MNNTIASLLELFLLRNKAKVIRYTPNYNNKEIYVFDDIQDYYNYFRRYGVDFEEQILDSYISRILHDGRVVAHKRTCDNAIQYFLVDLLDERVAKLDAQLTPEKIEEIHSRGNITFREKAKEWNDMDLCVLGDYASSAAFRCNTYNHDCKKCLLDTASHSLEHKKIDFKLVNLYDGEPWHNNSRVLIKNDEKSSNL